MRGEIAGRPPLAQRGRIGPGVQERICKAVSFECGLCGHSARPYRVTHCCQSVPFQVVAPGS